MAKKIDFKVCCRCFTFNQSKYITDTMNGFCMQETNFPFVCCMVDDASTDGEQEVIRKYILEHFNVADLTLSYEKETDYAYIIYAQHKINRNCYFAVVLLKKNLYSKKQNYMKMQYISEWRDICEYEAICEGDDYWTNKDKLQIQVDYMNNNPDCLLCHGKAKRFYQSEQKLTNKYVGKDFKTFENLLMENPVSTMTTMLKVSTHNRFIEEKKTWNKNNWMMGDYTIWLWCSAHGYCHFFDIDFGVYRVLENSASHSKNTKQNNDFYESFHDIRCFYAKKYNVSEAVFQKILLRNDYSLLKRYCYGKNIKMFIFQIASLVNHFGKFLFAQLK